MEWKFCDAVNLAADMKRDGDPTPIDQLVAELWAEMEAENEEARK